VPVVRIYNTHVQDSQPNVNIVHTDRFDATPRQADVPKQDDIDIVDDGANKFSDDKESFVLMTPDVTMSQQIASQTQGSLVSFRKSMMNMLGDRLWKVPMDFQFRSPFESTGHRPIVPLTKALALMKKIEHD
jgi:hypothetical protein